MGALSPGLCRPFHRLRDGVAFGEAGALLALEDYAHASARGATIYAELAGYGMSNDAFHVTAPEPSGSGFARAITQALASSRLHGDDVDYVNAHGTGTRQNDVAEASALRQVFGTRCARVPVSSNKAALGHTNGAAGALEAIACVLALEYRRIPPTLLLDDPDPELGLDLVRGAARSAHLRTCLNLSAGFGGFNVCTVWRRTS